MDSHSSWYENNGTGCLEHDLSPPTYFSAHSSKNCRVYLVLLKIFNHLVGVDDSIIHVHTVSKYMERRIKNQMPPGVTVHTLNFNPQKAEAGTSRVL